VCNPARLACIWTETLVPSSWRAHAALATFICKKPSRFSSRGKKMRDSPRTAGGDDSASRGDRANGELLALESPPWSM
jgi:hypothetical protein